MNQSSTAKLTARDLPLSVEMIKNPAEKYLVSEIVGFNLRDWDFIFLLEDDLGHPTKVWGATFSGDRWNTTWRSDAFDYQLDDEVTLIWERKIF